MILKRKFSKFPDITPTVARKPPPLSEKIGPNQGGGFLENPDGTKLELRFGHFPPRNRDLEGPKNRFFWPPPAARKFWGLDPRFGRFPL